jgi:hypothetical protein
MLDIDGGACWTNWIRWVCDWELGWELVLGVGCNVDVET